MDISYLLEISEFFKKSSPQSKDALAKIAIAKTYPKRKILFTEGDEGHSVFLLAGGAIQLHKMDAEGKEVVIKMVRVGEMFGEIVLFEKDVYPVTAVALQKSLVYLLPIRQFHGLLENPDFRNDFLAMLMGKLRFLTGQMLSLGAHDVQKRFLRFLEEQFGRRETYRLSVGKKDVALAVGTTPETFSRLLLRMKKQGTLTWEGDTVRLSKGYWNDASNDDHSSGRFFSDS